MTKIVVTISTAKGLQTLMNNFTTYSGSSVYVVLYSDAAISGVEEELSAKLKSIEDSASIKSKVVVYKEKNRLSVINSILDKENLLSGDDPTIVIDEFVEVRCPFINELNQSASPPKLMATENDVFSGGVEIGLCGVCLNNTDNPDQLVVLTEAELSVPINEYAGRRLTWFAGTFVTVPYVDESLVCMWPSVRRVMSNKKVLNPNLGEYAWQDLSVRLLKEGLHTIASQSVFATVDRERFMKPQHVGSVQDRLRYYAEHQKASKPTLCVIYRASLQSVHDLAIMKRSVIKSSEICDYMVIVLKNNPLEIQGSQDYKATKSTLSTSEKRLFEGCDNADKAKVEREFVAWVHRTINTGVDAGTKIAVTIPMTTSQTDDINEGIKMADMMAPDAALFLESDEMIDQQLTKDRIHQIIRHPDPLKLGFDFEINFHWDSPTLIRTGPPFGRDSNYQNAPHRVRLFRKTGKKLARCTPMKSQIHDMPVPSVPEGCVAVSGYRIQSFSLLRSSDRTKVGLSSSEEHFSVSSYTKDTSLGFHFLCYENESPDDVARWLSEIMPIAESMVMVWTGSWGDDDMGWLSDESALRSKDWPKTGPSRELAAICRLFGCDIVYRPLDDNLAEARNAGIDTLSKNSNVKWAMFVDPDEWFRSPQQDLRCIRSMTASDRLGYLFKIANYRAGSKQPTISDSVRISRADLSAELRMAGRVHESFDKSIQSLQSKGVSPRLCYAPFTMSHRGLAFDAGKMDEKLDKYERLLRLDLAEDSKNPGAWVSLGWHYLNEGHDVEAEACFKNALDCAGESYLPFKEMAFLRLRESRTMIEECLQRIAPSHQFYDLCKEMDRWLHNFAPPHPIIDRGRKVEAQPVPKYKLEHHVDKE